MEKCQKLCDHALSVLAEMQPLSEYGWKINTKEKKAECKPRCELHPQLTSTTCLYHFDKDSINRLSNIKSSLVTAPSSGHIGHLHLHEAQIFPFTYFVTRYLYTCLLDLWGYLVQCLIPSKVPPFFLTAQQEDGRQQQQQRSPGGACLGIVADRGWTTFWRLLPIGLSMSRPSGHCAAASTVTRSWSNGAPLGWDATNLQQLCDAAVQHGHKSLWLKYATKGEKKVSSEGSRVLTLC